ncbi:hypothetical protein [Paraburkholderia aromaticivorans]|uniref:Uncharacterized protein n=1 Tax=Paraburkholderia aromaticivorans TaxID=2026199 RepID=A0A248VCD9_9BURK|nr:hypothetical protein [Paraburkholderia aromaticivorans]ASV96725.1 hypothetical protein CJU94_00135 [Paraburkholderia aromaticivorans]
MQAQNVASDSAIFNSLGACWLHAMVEIDRLHEQCGAKRVTVRIPLSGGRVVYAAFVACDHNAAALRRVVRAVASSGLGAWGRLANLAATDRRFAMPYGGCGESRREAIYWLERTIEMAVRKPGRGEHGNACG